MYSICYIRARRTLMDSGLIEEVKDSRSQKLKRTRGRGGEEYKSTGQPEQKLQRTGITKTKNKEQVLRTENKERKYKSNKKEQKIIYAGADTLQRTEVEEDRNMMREYDIFSLKKVLKEIKY